MAPDWREYNPYLKLLVTSLTQLGYRVEFPVGYRRGLPLFRALLALPSRPQILHLQWQEGYLRYRSFPGQLLHAFRLVLDLFLVRFILGCRIVWTVHNSVPHGTRYPRLHLFLKSILARLASRVVFHHADGMAHFHPLLPLNRAKASVVPHGDYRDQYGAAPTKAAAREALQLPPDAHVALFFGLINPYKGVEDLLTAWRAGSMPADCLLIIAGKVLDLDLSARLQDLAQADPRIRLHLDFIPDAQVSTWLAAADAMVFPFRKIQTSGSLVLAQSYGLPVLVPDFPSIREQLGFYPAHYFRPNDVAALSQCLQSLLTSPPADRPVPLVIPWSETARLTAREYALALGLSPA